MCKNYYPLAQTFTQPVERNLGGQSNWPFLPDSILRVLLGSFHTAPTFSTTDLWFRTWPGRAAQESVGMGSMRKRGGGNRK